jgi:hypothetical protein
VAVAAQRVPQSLGRDRQVGAFGAGEAAQIDRFLAGQ